ncbi:MAG: HIT domain-containing protein [Patescibacteria group bacterium]|nr:HIT domain-containing protein [Patescibacteria group bacterium]
MSDCIFCKIVKGEIPSYKVYEDKEFLGFLDISQIVDGHTLLIPKKHVRWIWDIENIGGFYKVAKKIVKKMQEVSGKKFVMSVTWGTMVEHAHLHLLPTTAGNRDIIGKAWIKARETRKLSDEKMKVIQKKFQG